MTPSDSDAPRPSRGSAPGLGDELLAKAMHAAAEGRAAGSSLLHGSTTDEQVAAPPRRISVPTKANNPYVGPRPFKPGELLYGRRRETDSLVDLLLAERVVLLHSPSGAGKTSLLQAQVLPRLQAEGLDVLPPARVNSLCEVPPGVAFNRYVVSALLSLEKERPKDEQREASELVGMTIAEYLWKRPRVSREAPEVVILDQFEELLTVDPSDVAGKEEFCRQLGEALKVRTRWAIIAMREEFMGALAPYLHHIPTCLAHRTRLELLTPETAREAITQPADKAGRRFSAEAVERLVKDLGGTEGGAFVEPVHLQVVCTQLWDRVPDGVTEIKPADVEGVGGVDEALMAYFAHAVARAAAAGGCQERDVRAWVEDELIVDRRRAQALTGTEAKSGVTPAAVKALEDRYVLRREERRGGVWLELAHDRLVGPVLGDNARWRTANLDTLEQSAIRWAREGRPDDLLVSPLDPEITGAMVAALTRRRPSHSAPADAQLAAFMRASVRRFRLRMLGFFGLVLLFVLSWALTVQSRKSRARLERTKRELETVKESLKVVNGQLALANSAKSDSLRDAAEQTRVQREVAAGRAFAVPTLTPRPARAPSGASAPPVDPRAIELQHFGKQGDPPKLGVALRTLGYDYRLRSALAAEVPTNFVAAGSRVPVADLRRIALAVADAGVSVRGVCRFTTDRRVDGGDRSLSVQVLGVDVFEKLPTLSRGTLEAIGGARALPCPQ